MDISDRRRMVLAAIIAMHTRDGEPVGSHSLLDRFNISSATIRNEMAALTDLGLLEQPHTSAGRIPTAEGYRYYIHNLMRIYPLTASEKKVVDSAIEWMDTDPDKAAEEAARVLSQTTGLAAISTSAHGRDAYAIHFELIRVGKYNIAVLAVINSGAVKSHVVRLSREATDDELRTVERVLNQRALFVNSEDVSDATVRSIVSELGELSVFAAPLVKGALSVIELASDVRVYTSGQQNLLRFRELDRFTKQLFDIFSDNSFIIKCFDGVKEPVAVLVGDEYQYGAGELSMVLSRYRASGGMSGGIGVVGPVRMNYEYIIPRLKYFCDRLSEVLTETRKGENNV